MDFGGGLSIALNVISAVASIIVITMMVFVYVIDRRLMDRVSLRFTLAISIVDFLKAVAILIYIFVDAPGIECVILAYLIPVFTLLYMFLTICIALNLQLTFVNGLRFNSKWEKWYWCVSIVGAFGIMAVPLAMDQLGFDEDTLYCTYKDSLSPNTQIFIWATYHSWVLAGCFYCTLIVIIVIFNLNRKVTIINRICEPEYYTDEKGKRVNINEKVQKSLKRLIRRISLYCLIPVLTQIGYVASQIYSYHNPTSPHEVLVWWSFVGTDSPGLLNLFAFLLDPSLFAAIKSIRNMHSTHSSTTLKEENPPIELKMHKSSVYLNVTNDPLPPPVPEKDDHISDVNQENQENQATRSLACSIPEVDISLGEIKYPSTSDGSFQSTAIPMTPNTITSFTPLADDRWEDESNAQLSIHSEEDTDMAKNDESEIFHESDSGITLDHFLRGL